MGKTHKEKITLQTGEAYVVADKEFWNHVILMYESQVESSNDDWQQMADYIRSWIDATLVVEEEEEDWV